MDMIFRRYACPFDLMDEMIASCRLLEWVDKIVIMHNEEDFDKVQWEFFLHKVFDKTYDQFVEECKMNQRRQSSDKDFDFEATKNNSKNMLEGFVPEG